MSSAESKPSASAFEYSKEERSLLVALAHRAIETALAGGNVDTTAPSEHLAQLRGAFTTLYLEGELRGCVGYIGQMYPLYRTVAETAQAAAFHDKIPAVELCVE